MMDTTFYEDSRFRGSKECGSTAMKRPMTLDLDSGKNNSSSKKPRMTTLLTSPDLNMLKLASPELEKLIMAQHTGLVGPPPSQCMYPKGDDRDQQYASRDFTDALSSLQQVVTSNMNVALYQQPLTIQSDMNMVSNVSNCIMPPCSTTMVDSYGYNTNNQPQQHHQQQPLSSINLNCNPMVSSTLHSNCYAPNGYYNHHEPIVSIKEEPQTVPCMGTSPPESPIDMEDQERLKLERKRLRNRIAASKCRRRKLERIARLEDKVTNLKNENTELVNHVTRLRECICQLKEEVMSHVRSGCEMLMSTYPADL